MKKEEEIKFINEFAAKNKCYFEENGEIGIGRKCVGIIHDGHYPEYPDESDAQNPGGNAYHKGPYLAVLGEGEEAINELYKWIKKLDENGYVIEIKDREIPKDEHPIQTFMSGMKAIRFIKSPH